ncbi:MAG: hypothetical protein QG639_1079, partial [Patescibacteria group bacterium]|nr:hypothetical protein [Patescibacteria group bacterium]
VDTTNESASKAGNAVFIRRKIASSIDVKPFDTVITTSIDQQKSRLI